MLTGIYACDNMFRSFSDTRQPCSWIKDIDAMAQAKESNRMATRFGSLYTRSLA